MTLLSIVHQLPTLKTILLLMKWFQIGYENVIKYLHNFDAVKYKSPFSYFNKIIWYAFLRKIEVEKKRLESKIKYEERFNIFGINEEGYDQYKGSDGHNEYVKEFLKKRDETRARKNERAQQKLNSSSSGKLVKRTKKSKVKWVHEVTLSR